MRIWDFRGLSDEELDGLRDQVMALAEASPLQEPTSLHPRLASAVVRLRLGDVAHCVESYAPSVAGAGGASAGPAARHRLRELKRRLPEPSALR